MSSQCGSSGTQETKGDLKWWQLSLLGVACTIGTGYFLGSALAIHIGGPAILAGFVLAALGTYTVFDVLSKMTADHPEKGSFRSYAKRAFGRWAGFSSGWVYWASELLIMGSQLTALSIFSRFWFPGIPMWIFAAGYAVLGLIVILVGNKLFDSIENVLSVIKIAAILMFIVIAAAALFGWIRGGGHRPEFPHTAGALLPHGFTGLWAAFIYAFYAYGGIEVLGLMSLRLKKPEQAPMAGKIMLIMLITLTILYVLSLGLAVTMVAYSAFDPKKSPFITALGSYALPFIPHVFNGVLIIAGFSTMVASLYAVTTMLVTLAEDSDAPPVFAKKVTKKELPLLAIGLTAVGLIASIVLALAMPGKIYEYVTTAAGLMLLYNWLFILFTAGKLLELKLLGQIMRFTGMALILLAVAGTLFHGTSRPGLWGSLIFVLLIGGITVLLQFTVWKKKKPDKTVPKRRVAIRSNKRPAH
ncbi:amino acid permease [Paenibacillus sp. CAA11]|uniref:amino acid permease n=1 Tax=Paenibacillus sp. CAA11 TaxID=1532905 RepID=UPI000D38D28B|nr:amino acid permease [Paenibacillus sp. CAA11]AWB46019.1 amino acid permease [Paenibacillus sp. CAA11]